VNPLIKKDPPPDDTPVAPPATLKINTSGFSIDSSHPKNFSITATIYNFFRLLDGAMVPVIKTKFQDKMVVFLFGFDYFLNITYRPARRFFTKNMLAMVQGRNNNFRSKLIRCCDKNRIDVRI
jgi:hypothetical protein